MARFDRGWPDRGQGSAFMAGMIGAVIGAIGAAAAIFLSNKENRRLVRQKIDEMKEKGSRSLQQPREQGAESEEAEEKLARKGGETGKDRKRNNVSR